MRHRGLRARCWATKPVEMLERTAFVREGGPIFLTLCKYEEACLERRRDFTPMIYSVDGMADKHARAAEKRIAGILAAKWTRQYSQIASFVRTRMCIAIVRSNTLLLRGDRAMNWRRRAPDDGVAARAAMTIRVQ